MTAAEKQFMKDLAAYPVPDARFKACLAVTILQEGVPGNDDDKRDPGGRTSRGIIAREWNAYRQVHHRSELSSDVWKAPNDCIIDIYYLSFWKPYCSRLWAGLDLMFFDQNVNEGTAQATRDLQRALGVAVDGHLGIVTQAAIDAVEPAAQRDLINLYTKKRLGFYHYLRGFPYFGKGWTRRADVMNDASLTMLPKGA